MWGRPDAQRYAVQAAAIMGRLSCVFSLLFCLTAWSAGCHAQAPETSNPTIHVETPLERRQGWDITLPAGKVRKISFDTTEGSWMSVSIAPDGRTIAFDLLGSIYAVPASGGDAVRLSRNAGIALDYEPVFSPDGRQIAFISDRLGQDALWLMNADGTNPHCIFFEPQSRLAEPQWLPSGKELVAVRRQATTWGTYRTNDTIWIFPLDGSAPRRLTSSDPPIEQPTGEFAGMDRAQSPGVSSDGRYVYFGVGDFMGGNRRIQRADLLLQRSDRLTEAPEWRSKLGQKPQPLLLGEIAPRPSPDGRWLAFVRRLPGTRLRVGQETFGPRSALWLRDLANGSERIVMDPVEQDQMADLPMWKSTPFPNYSWSKDGRFIFISQGGHLRRLAIDTGEVTTIPFRAHVERIISEQVRTHASLSESFKPHYARSPVQSFDGKRVAIEAAGRIWITGARGGQATPLPALAEEDGLARFPAWSPDSKKIAFVSSGGSNIGALWVQPADGGGIARRVSSEPALLASPFWSSDGQWIYVNRWPAALDRPLVDAPAAWELWRYPADGQSSGEPVSALGYKVHPSNKAGHIYYLRPSMVPASGIPQQQTTLIRAELDGKSPEDMAIVHGTADSIAVSPDERLLAIEQFGYVWLAPNNHLAPIDVLDPRSGASRIGRVAGTDPFWVNSQTLIFASRGHFARYVIDGSKLTEPALDLSLERDFARGRLRLHNATLITLSPDAPIVRGDVVIVNGRISCVGVCPAPAEQTLDLTGKTIIPGLVDVHSHSTVEDPDFLPLKRAQSAIYLAYGVTTIHDPSSISNPSFILSDLIDAGLMVGPRTFSTGEAVYQEARGWDVVHPVLTAEDADDEVARRADEGALSLKDYRLPTRAQRQMFIAAARRRKVTVTQEGGEYPYILGQIMDGGTGWEHPVALYPMYSDLVQFLGAARTHYSNQMENVGYPGGLSLDYWVGGRDLWGDSKLQLWMPWRDIAARRIFGHKPADEYPFGLVAQDMARVHAAGAYTPLGGHSMVDGLGMHFELWGLAAGSSPENALRAATLDGAHFLGLDSEIGSIESGKVADLVILDANPLDDIHNSIKIRYVMKGGRLRDATTLDELWPQRRPFGSAPWRAPEMFKGDSKPVNYWDFRAGAR